MTEKTLEGMIDRVIARKLAIRKRELQLANVCADNEMNALIQAHSPNTWKELSSGMQHTLDELAALTDNGYVPECLAHVADALDTALCDMQYQLDCWLGESDVSD